MKKVLLIAMALMLVSSAAMADHIGIYADQLGTSCTLVPPAFAPFTMYVIQKFSAGSTASEFKFVDNLGLSGPPSFTAAAGMLVAGDGPYVDMSLGYSAGCIGPENLLGTLGAFGFPVPSPTCGSISIAPGDSQTDILVADCEFQLHPATGGTLHINADGTCSGPCEPSGVEESTWGKVKSLYR